MCYLSVHICDCKACIPDRPVVTSTCIRMSTGSKAGFCRSRGEVNASGSAIAGSRIACHRSVAVPGGKHCGVCLKPGSEVSRSHRRRAFSPKVITAMVIVKTLVARGPTCTSIGVDCVLGSEADIRCTGDVKRVRQDARKRYAMPPPPQCRSRIDQAARRYPVMELIAGGNKCSFMDATDLPSLQGQIGCVHDSYQGAASFRKAPKAPRIGWSPGLPALHPSTETSAAAPAWQTGKIPLGHARSDGGRRG